MPKRYRQINRFDGLSNLLNPRDIGSGLSKAQNVSIDKRGMIRTIGGLADLTKVDGVTALTQTAKIAPGGSLFTYGSDHWRGTDTVVDMLSQLNATSDHDADNDGPDAVTGWDELGGSNPTVTSVADTDGGAIASNGTSYILKVVLTVNTGILGQTITTVIGQRYKIHIDYYNVDCTAVELRVGSLAEQGTDLLFIGDAVTIGSWFTISGEFVATTTTTYITADGKGGAADIFYLDDAYLTAIARRDLDTNWLALLDAATAQVDLYNVNDDSFTAGLLDFGTVFSYVATIDTINFPTTKTITDSTSQFLNKGMQAGDIRIISGSALNNIMFVVEHVTAGTIRARGNPFVVDADDDGTVTLTKYNPVAFHYVNEALRASPVSGGIALRPKHYSFVDRTHFEGAGKSERFFSNWYANDVGPVKPTDISAEADAGDQDASALTGGAGWEVGITTTADDGEWTAGTYVIACFFTYDDGQMSALYVPSTDEEFGTTIVDGDSLTITVRGKNDYDERISGGGVCCRLDESDEPWSLLADISMAKGARATLSGTYNAWAESATADVAYTAAFKSIKLNLDSYESLAGIDPTTTVETFSGDNAFWNASVIGGNRCFIFAPRYTDAGGNLQQFRGRIMYSQVNAYDTFPIDNIIDVVKGDAEDYVVGGIYGNDLLAFKSRTLYIIDISDPDPAGWQMKQDKNKGKYPRRGVAHPGAYFETPHSPAWCNEFGVFLYTGGEIVELLKDKIEMSEHPLAYQRYYYLDGGDTITVTGGDQTRNHTNDFSVECMIKSTEDTAGAGIVTMLDASDDGWRITCYSDGNVWASLNAVDVKATSGAVLDGNWHHVVFTADRSGNGQIYVDGVADGPAVAISGVPTMAITTGTVTIGNGQIADFALARLWNRVLSAAEVLALSNGQPVLAADQWGKQTNPVSAWTNKDFDTFTTSGLGISEAISGAAGDNCYSAISLTDGDVNTVEFDISVSSGLVTSVWFRITSDDSLTADQSTNQQLSLGHNTITLPAAVSTDDFAGFWTAAACTFAITNFNMNVLGCVAEWAPKSIGDATWTDSSTNDLDGTVVGATAIYEDSWAKFWTNYSQLGHQARTNQLIIMRDCTGKWSSGQDYGDVWIIDLDTGASTTGRRVFTKGIAYSNWATDWDQELIIAEQTSTTSVTIKQWTDEPQSQAAGLIDIRLADMDYGNQMINKEMNAFLATYKSSATQTNALSYALNGDDRQTAWIRLTGTLDPEGYWEELKIEPTDFNVKSIRLRIDNPTAAGTLELNDLGTAYREILESI